MEWEEVSDLAAVAADVDVLYQTRIQKERFLDRLQDYSAARGKYVVDGALLRLMKPSACIMHPLPRVDEVGYPPPPPPPLPRCCRFRLPSTSIWLSLMSSVALGVRLDVVALTRLVHFVMGFEELSACTSSSLAVMWHAQRVIFWT